MVAGENSAEEFKKTTSSLENCVGEIENGKC